MHQNVLDLQRSHSGEHLRVELAAGDVVDNVGAGFDGFGGGEAIAGVDRDEGVGRELVAEQRDQRGKAVGLFLWREKGGTGSGGNHPEVDDVGTLVEQFAGMGHNGVGCGVASAIVERVGCGVQNAHDYGTVESVLFVPAKYRNRMEMYSCLHDLNKKLYLCFWNVETIFCFFNCATTIKKKKFRFNMLYFLYYA